MKAKDALLRQLIADGIDYIFGNPGTTEQAFMDALQDHPGLNYVLCLHEGVAVSMADAYARASGHAAFVQLHIAPGLGNALGMLYNAHAAHSPMVVYVGQSATDALFQEPLLSGDLVAMATPVTKWAYQIDRADDVPAAVRRAFKVAMEPPQGPVLLSVPIDVMDSETAAPVVTTSHPSWRVHPDPAALAAAAQHLRASANPVLLIGDGVAAAGAQYEAERLARALGAPIVLGYSTEANVPAGCPLVVGSLPSVSATAPAATRKLLGAHDVILAVGTPLFRFVFPEAASPLRPDQTVIQLDLDGWELSKNIPTTLSIHADCAVGLGALADLLEKDPPGSASERLAHIEAGTTTRRDTHRRHDIEAWEATPISVPRLMSELAAVLPGECMIFDEAMTSSAALLRYVDPVPGRYFRARGGGIGPGLPGTLGLKLARPDLPVVGVVSDGAAMYSTTALWTAAHHDIAVVWVVCNNGGYRILQENLIDYLGPSHHSRRFVELKLAPPELRFDRIAESMGVAAVRVERPQDVGPAVRAALATGHPALIDVVVAGLPS
jgi:benzoylformate decarboxylase